MSGIEWTTLLVLVVVLLGWYLSYTAARLHRLHTRIEGTYAALGAQFVRRAEAVLEVATSELVDPASALLLADAASASLDRQMGTLEQGLDRDRPREEVESLLTARLRQTLPAELVHRELAGEGAAGDHAMSAASLGRLLDAHERMAFARRIHNEAVADAVHVRSKLVVRMAHLPGRTDMPQPVELDDNWPA